MTSKLFPASPHLQEREGTKREKEMKPSPVEYVAEVEEDQGMTIAMDVDYDLETLELFGEGPIPTGIRIADADFFNSFEDDFDETDIN